MGFVGCVWAFSFYVRADISLGGILMQVSIFAGCGCGCKIGLNTPPSLLCANVFYQSSGNISYPVILKTTKN